MFCCLIHASLGSLDVDAHKTAGALEAIAGGWGMLSVLLLVIRVGVSQKEQNKAGSER